MPGRIITLFGADGSGKSTHAQTPVVPLTQVQEACSSVAQCQLVPIAGAQHNMIVPAKESIISGTATFLHARVTGA